MVVQGFKEFVSDAMTSLLTPTPRLRSGAVVEDSGIPIPDQNRHALSFMAACAGVTARRRPGALFTRPIQ